MAYYNEYEDEKKEVILLAIGGINFNNTEYINIENKPKVAVYKIRWKKILNEVENIKKRLESVKSFSDNANSYIRILEIVLKGFELHGFLTIKWFKDINDDKIISKSDIIKQWIPNKNYLFNLKNTYQIENKIIKLWKL